MRSRLVTFATMSALLIAHGPFGCGGDDDGDADAALGADASETVPDAAATTVCGPEGEEFDCTTADEICVVTDLAGGAPVYSCEPVPAGCGPERSCRTCAAVCMDPADICDDLPADNTLSCFCPDC